MLSLWIELEISSKSDIMYAMENKVKDIVFV